MFDADFEIFWRAYPAKVGKLAARTVYDKVRRGGIRQDELLDGIAQYIATKPAYADFCHPRTWLAQGRWMDEVKPHVEHKRPLTAHELDDAKRLRANVYNGCPHDPRCLSYAACVQAIAWYLRTGQRKSG